MLQVNFIKVYKVIIFSRAKYIQSKDLPKEEKIIEKVKKDSISEEKLIEKVYNVS